MVPNNNQQFGPTDQANFSADNGSPKNHSYRMIFITVVVLLIAIGGFIISRNENLQQVIKDTVPFGTSPGQDSTTSAFVAPPDSVITDRQIPWVEVISQNGAALPRNQSATFMVNASSAGKDITGYDVLLAIDPNQFEIESITSEVAGFSILQFEKGTHVAITGIKELGQNSPSIFNETPLLKIMVKPVKSGDATISVLVEKENERTMLVDTEVNPITPQVGSLKVSVQ